MKPLIAPAMLLGAGADNAETVYVRCRGLLDLAPFICETVTRSSQVQRVCYDGRNAYTIVVAIVACLSTSRRRRVDSNHVQSLKYGGVYHPSNTQWQTREAAMENDRWE